MSPWAADWASAEETFEFAWLAGELLEPDEPHPASARPAATGIRYLSRLKSGMAMRPSCDVPPEFLLKGQVVGWSPAMVSLSRAAASAAGVSCLSWAATLR